MLIDQDLRRLDLSAITKQQKLWDGGGLFLLLAPRSSGWRFRYQRDGREQLLSLGTFPAVSLAEARKARDELRTQLKNGVDPGERRKVRKAAHIESRTHTFGTVGAEMLEADDSTAVRTKVRDRWLFKLLRSLHSRPIADLKTPEIVRTLRTIQDTGDRRETAHRCARLVTRICRFAVQSGYAVTNPASELRGALKPVKTESHAAITDPKELGRLLKYIGNYDLVANGHATVTAALKMAPYVFVRPGELRQAEWSEIDLDKAEWVLPGAKMKMRRPHLVPLASQVVELLKTQRVLTGGGRYVFPGRNNSHRPLSDAALGKALKLIFFNSDVQTAHGFRATASTLLNGELNYDSAVIELQLAHAKSDKVAAIYDRAQRLPERRAMMQAWADYLDSLRSSYGKESAA
jgi:integrase